MITIASDVTTKNTTVKKTIQHFIRQTVIRLVTISIIAPIVHIPQSTPKKYRNHLQRRQNQNFTLRQNKISLQRIHGDACQKLKSRHFLKANAAA